MPKTYKYKHFERVTKLNKMNTQGERIKKIRQELDLSQDDFGKIFNIQKQQISSIEKDKLKLNNEKLELLCSQYNININWVLCGIGEMFITAPQNTQDKTELVQTVKDTMKELFVQYGLDDMAKKISEQK